MSSQSHTIAVPVHNLVVSSEIGGVFEIERVKFVSSEKIPRIRKSLNLPLTVGELTKRFRRHNEVFTKAPTYAFISVDNPEEPDLIFEHNLIREAIWLLRSSQFGREKRTNEYAFGFPEHRTTLIDEEYLIETVNERINLRRMLVSPIRPYKLDNAWKKYVSHHFFPYLLKILNKKAKITSEWRFTIRKAAILAGKSHYASELSQAFLYGVIGIETLLNTGERGDKLSKSLYNRINALLGWIHSEPKQLQKMVERIYKLRCEFVHHGEYKNIMIQDLLATDELLRNLLYNICRNIRLFSSRQKIVDLAAQIEARKILAQKLRRPNSLRYTRRSVHTITREIEQLRKVKKWPSYQDHTTTTNSGSDKVF